VVLVVGVEDDALVVGEELGGRGPPGAEPFDVGDDLLVVAACFVIVSYLMEEKY